jgi:SAM-dependent methyltransferase
VTGYHGAHLTRDPARATVWKVVAAHLSPYIPPQARVLEIGAGYCDWINSVAAAERVAVDIWPGLSGFAGAAVQPVVLDASCDLRTLGESTFDVVLASNVLEHFAPDVAGRVTADIAAVLKPQGRVIVVQPNFRLAWRRYFDDYTHRAIFTDVSLPSLLRANGFEIERVEARFLPYSMRESRLPIRAWMVGAYMHSTFKPMAGQMLVIARRH